MKKRLMLLTAVSVLTMAGCSYNLNANGPRVADTTIMIYMCGADLESEHYSDYNSQGILIDKGPIGLATADLKEILSVKGQPDDVNIIVQTGGAKEWSKELGISSKELGRYHVENNNLVKDDHLLKASMGSKKTFQSFLEWGLTEYPAEKTGVILWNHGGALDGVCFDESFRNDSLTDNEVAEAIKGAFKTVGRTEKLDWIGYDACLMSVQDIAEINSNYFKYMVASEEAEVGEGWAYDAWVDDLYEHKPVEEVLTAVCDGFIKSVDDMVDYYRRYGYDMSNDQNLSVINLDNIGAYKDAIETLAGDIKTTVSTNKTSFRTIMKRVKSYANQVFESNDYYTYTHYYGYPTSWFSNNNDGTYTLHGYYFYGTFDAYDALVKMENSALLAGYSEQIQAAKDALDDVILYNKRGNAAGESNGLCVVVPMEDYYNQVNYSANFTNFSNWRALFR